MLSEFDYVKPRNLKTALEYLQNNPGTKILAGGTDLLVLLRRNLLNPDHLMDIKGIAETQTISYESGKGLWIGASITVNQVADDSLVSGKFPALAQAAGALASYQVRNRATVVGNLCNASPGADLSAPLLIYDTVVHVASAAGERTVLLADFFTGVKKTVLRPEEMVTGIWLPEPVEGVSVFYKQARLKGHDLGIVAVAAQLTEAGRVSLALSAVAPTPLRLTPLEEGLSSQPLTVERAEWAGTETGRFIHPISDVRSSEDYRRHAATVLVKRALVKLLSLEEERHVHEA